MRYSKKLKTYIIYNKSVGAMKVLYFDDDKMIWNQLRMTNSTFYTSHENIWISMNASCLSYDFIHQDDNVIEYRKPHNVC